MVVVVVATEEIGEEGKGKKKILPLGTNAHVCVSKPAVRRQERQATGPGEVLAWISVACWAQPPLPVVRVGD